LTEVCVLSLSGIVSLKGTVHSRADRLVAHEAAARAKGVVGVINGLSMRKRNSIRRRAVVKSQVSRVSPTFHLPTQENLRSSQVAN
jgi:osmotically-inducible protein OsmY